MTTRLGLFGGPRLSYGDFSGKTPASGGGGSKDPVTRLGLYGGPAALYGDFSGKTPSSGGGGGSKDPVTRLGLYGGPRLVYGDFSGKPEGVPTIEQGGGSGGKDHRRRIILPPRAVADIQDVAVDIELVALAMIAIEEIEANEPS